jgi:hypothetical protein
MKWHLRLLAAAAVMVALVGCANKPDTVKGSGSYAPIITGLHNNSGEPAIRGIPNSLQVLVTNVNGLLLTIHWEASAGVLSDSTGEDAVWTPPDSVGNYTVTVSLTATDSAGASFFKTTTFPMYVDNEYERWTRSDGIQFDVAPTNSGELLYAELRNNITGEADVYRVSAPFAAPLRLTQDFFSLNSPTPRGDEMQFAFAGRRRSTDSTSIWLLPWSGGDTLSATKLTQGNNQGQLFLAHPRFSWEGGFLMYASDSQLVGFPKLRYRDIINPAPPVNIVSNSGADPTFLLSYMPANWGPGGTSTTPPDSVIAQSQIFFGFVGQASRGAFKFRTPLFGGMPNTSDMVWVADTTVAEPDWSSDGNYIVFSRKAIGAKDRDIWLLATNATSFSQAVQITRGPADDSHPRFARDGQSIFFVSNRQDRYGLNGIFATERRGTNLWRVRRYDLP